jgi:uncharacterized protein with von Willebrand factor type A (vWA) domain
VIRLINEVPRWSCYLHRSARGLPRADAADLPTAKLEDELFERIFAWEMEPLPERDRDRMFGDWAQRIHDTVTQLPAFERLAQECRGRADESALAVEALINELRPDGKDNELRQSARTACSKASQAVEQLRDAMEGLEHVAFGPVPGTGTSLGGAVQDGGVRSLAARLRDDARLRKIANLAGRFKRIAGAKRRSRVRHGCDEVVDIEFGADLGKLLPLELALLVHPKTRLMALRNFLERQCMQYRLEGIETLGRGPLVVALDKSASMEGDRDVWSTSVTLALLDLAQAEKRPFALLGFDGAVKHESIVMAGQALPEAGLFIPCDGGTNIDAAVRRGLEIIEQHPGALRKADIVLITDGGSNADDAHELRERAVKLGVTVLGVAIDVEPERLSPWCDDHVIAVNDMTRVDDKTAETLFTL